MNHQSRNDILVARFTAYLVKIAKHTSYDYFRQKRRYESNKFSHNAASYDTVEFAQLYDALRAPQTDFEFEDSKIQYAYQKLNEQRRQVLKYTFLYGLSEEEIAKLVGVKPDYVRVVRFRALQSMRKILGLEEHNE